MIKMFRILFFSCLVSVFVGCSYTSHNNIPESIPYKAKKVEVVDSYFNLFYLFPENYTAYVLKALANQCDKGVYGISMDVQRRFWPLLGENVTLEARGYCGE